MGKTQAQSVYPKGFDFKQIWAALMDLIVKESAERQQETDRILKENAERQAERQKETDRILRENAGRQAKRQRDIDRILKENAERQTERQWETDRILRENAEQQKEITRLLKENDRLLKENAKRQAGRQSKGFPSRFGEVAEYTLGPSLREKFKEFDLNFPKANSNTNISEREKNTFLEIDVLLESDDKAMLVEVVDELTTEDVKDHAARLGKMRAYADLHGDKRAFLGAVAGVTMANSVKKYALGQGFYVIEPSGESFNITPPNGQPKKW